MKKRFRSGRPPKFSEESSPITVTLPRRTVKNLQKIDNDRAKAIVKCVDEITLRTGCEKNKVDVVQVSKDTGLLVIPPSQKLKSIPWLQLIEITPLRYLMAIPTGTAVEALEIALVDLIENLQETDADERILLTDLRQKLSQHRRKDGLSKGEILFINTE